MKCEEPFGGKVLLIGGDFRQTLPVVKRGNRTTIAEACIKNSPLWSLFEVLRLTENMRAAEGEVEFADWVLNLGNGTIPTVPLSDDAIAIPNECLTTNLVDEIYGERITEDDLERLETTSIVSPLNEDCLKLNEDVFSKT